ncbi:MAG: hypothetical protein CMJ48_04235 [Planctomycetaceae bacterium]|nr:hypothetical protein [Planctomycetaceae bacterium]
MKSGRNPNRRNRKIGTAAQGRGQDNSLTIPQNWRDTRIYWEKMSDCRKVVREVYGTPISFFVQPPKPGFIHACTPDDVAGVLSLLPPGDVRGIGAVLLRQPTRKQALLSPVWGRLGFCVDVGPYQGAAIVLEAFNTDEPIKWSKSLGPDHQKELQRLERDGHHITATKREYVIRVSPESLRAGILYRTLLHEIGHWVDWTRSVEIPPLRVADETTWESREARYASRPQREREDAAHRYADQMSAELYARRSIPFAPRGLDRATLAAGNLELSYFVNPECGDRQDRT